MPKLVDVKKRLSIAELEHRFKRCRDPVEKTHYQAIMLRSQGMGTGEVARICGYKRDWVSQLVRRYNKEGPSVLGDGRKGNRRQPLLNEQQQEELRNAVLNEEPPGGGLWTGPKVAQWMADKIGEDVWPQRAWVYLKRLGLSKQSPRPKNPKSCPEAQRAFKKNSGGASR